MVCQHGPQGLPRGWTGTNNGLRIGISLPVFLRLVGTWSQEFLDLLFLSSWLQECLAVPFFGSQV